MTSLLPFKNIKHNVDINFEAGKFIVKTIETPEELKNVLKLRYDVYYRELIGDNGQEAQNDIDIDKYDELCDHLAVIRRDTGETVATYRIICSLFSNEFYSQSEFNIDNIIDQPCTKLELGRACVHKNYRKGIMIMLLWRAIAEYLKKTDSRFVFGCSSVQTTNVQDAATIYSLLSKSHEAPESYRVYPQPEYRYDNFQHYATQADEQFTPGPEPALNLLVPPLFSAYLSLGAISCGEPAVDWKFKCTDFLIVLEREKLDSITKRKYGI